MSREDKKYLKNISKKGPSFEVFEKLVKMLSGVQEKTKQLSASADTVLMESFKSDE